MVFVYLSDLESQIALELLEALLGAGSLRDLQCVEAHGLGDWAALADGGDVSDLNVPVCWE